MTLLDAVLLGILQGATEFLPISSSGHLVLGQVALGLRNPELLFDIVLHLGTLLAVVGFYRSDISMLATGLLEGLRKGWREGSWRRILEPEGARLAVLIGVGSIPTALIGLAIEKFVPLERGTSWAAVVVSGALVVNGVVLFGSRLAPEEGGDERTGPAALWNITVPVAIVVGITQGLAVMPGLSRSGMTITTALLLGVWRDQAARFSFLLSVPAILGALAVEFDPSVFEGPAVGTTLAVYAAGAVTAALVGYLAILWLVRLVERAQFHHFAWYCWALGGSGLAIFLL